MPSKTTQELYDAFSSGESVPDQYKRLARPVDEFDLLDVQRFSARGMEPTDAARDVIQGGPTPNEPNVTQRREEQREGMLKTLAIGGAVVALLYGVLG